jgi:tripeptide aminopeptidase
VLAPRNRDDVAVGADGRFRGPGVSDNGAGLAALLALAKALKSGPPLVEPPVPLLLIANVGEEGEGNLSGMRYLCRQSPLAAEIGAFLVLDGPATDHITAEALASQRFEITFSGQGGHSWSDFGIGNPVHALSRAIAFFTEQKIAPRNGSGPRCSYNFGLIEGGASVNSIPNSARAKLDIRSEDEEKVAELAGLLTVAVDRALEVENERASGGRLTARIREIGARPGGKLAEDAPLLSYVRAVDQYLGIRSHVDCSSTDANIPLSLGLPAVSIGTGGQGGGAHTSSEWYSPEGRDLGLKRIVLVLALLLRDLQSGAGRLAGE